MEDILKGLLIDYGYPILFVWSLMEGELGLVMAGLMSHMGHMDVPIAIVVAGVGGFVGDQFWFYVGRYNKKYTLEFLRDHRRKFAMAHILLKKHGIYLIFIQRYMYGMRTIIPLAIGTTKYDAKKFAIINFISAIIWAAMTIILTFYFGEPILDIVMFIKDHWYIFMPFFASFAVAFYYYVHIKSKPKPKGELVNKNENRTEQQQNIGD